MVLSDRDILAYLEAGKIKITPEIDRTKQLSSCSVDFRLGNTFMVFEHSRYSFIDPRSANAIAESMRKIVVPEGEPFMMQPGDFVLASTKSPGCIMKGSPSGTTIFRIDSAIAVALRGSMKL